MDQSRSSSRYAIQYAKDDPVVNRYLGKATEYMYMGWGYFGLLTLNAFIGIFEDSGRFGNMSALLCAGSALMLIMASGYRKSAWIRTLELRLDELQRSSQSAP